MSRRWTPAAAPVVLALLVAPSARAATLSVEKRCYRSGQEVGVTGSQFTAGGVAGVSIEGQAETQRVRVDRGGRFLTTLRVPRFRGRSLGPRTFTVSAIDATPGNTASPVSVWAVRRTLATNAPIEGDPRAMTTWRFAGFRPDRMIFGHFRHRSGNHTYRFGVARRLGPCGALDVRARRVPVPTLRSGRWRLQIDHERRYDRATTPRTIVRFQVYRRVGGG